MLIALIAYFLAQESEGISKAIPVVGAIALAAQRMLPVMQISYSSWSAIRRNQYTLKEVIEFLDQPLPEYLTKQSSSPISFNKEIALSDVSFQYKPELPSVLNGIELTIPKGARAGFIGSTGSGKTTMLDIIMGLLSPGNGRLLVDGITVDDLNRRSWQEHLAHVPQNIFLSDASIAENIAFGITKDEIDLERVEDCAKQAQLSDFISKLPQGLQTLVGERGTRLSGGQRQRIGIARALYKKADVIIFDEATSALDTKTEEAVMWAVKGLTK
jgi:ATP-binding cassette subfamily B protein